MNDKLFIPTKCKVGFNPRTDTYSGKLAYVIAQDGKKWRKETSWLGWIYEYIDDDTYAARKLKHYEDRKESLIKGYNNILNILKEHNLGQRKLSDYSLSEYTKETKDGLEGFFKYNGFGCIEDYKPYLGKVITDESFKAYEFDNEPTEGFVLNKKVGGYNSGWNHRQTYARIYDPRGFEFEITMDNLLFILQECNSIKGKALEGKFVYSWSGKDLVLLPTSSSDYLESVKFTEAKNTTVSTKELVVGCKYLNKDMETLVYIGRLKFIKGQYSVTIGVSHVFYKIESKEFMFPSSMASISSKIDDNCVDDFANIMTEFDKKHSVKNIRYEITEEVLPTHNYYRDKTMYSAMKDENGNIFEVSIEFIFDSNHYDYNRRISSYIIKSLNIITFVDDSIDFKKYNKFKKEISADDIKNLEFYLVKVSKNSDGPLGKLYVR